MLKVPKGVEVYDYPTNTPTLAISCASLMIAKASIHKKNQLSACPVSVSKALLQIQHAGFDIQLEYGFILDFFSLQVISKLSSVFTGKFTALYTVEWITIWVHTYYCCLHMAFRIKLCIQCKSFALNCIKFALLGVLQILKVYLKITVVADNIMKYKST